MIHVIDIDRFLEAKRDLKQGSLILSEQFLVAGPMRCSDIVCVGCHGELPSREINNSNNHVIEYLFR